MENPILRTIIIDRKYEVTHRQTAEQRRNKEPVVHFKTRYDHKLASQCVNFNDFEMRPPDDLCLISYGGGNLVYRDKVQIHGKLSLAASKVTSRTKRIERFYETHNVAHVNFREIITNLKHGSTRSGPIYDRMNVSDLNFRNFKCSFCTLAKVVNAQFETSLSPKAKRKGSEFIETSMDLSCTTTKIINTSIYIDEYIHYVRTFPLKFKNDASLHFLYLWAHIERQFKTTVQFVRTDNGEFQKLAEYLKLKGKIHEKTVAVVHEQKGLAERHVHTSYDDAC